MGVSLESRSMGTWVCPWRVGVWGHGCVPGEQEYGDMGVSLESMSMGTWVCPWRAGVWGHGCVPGEYCRSIVCWCTFRAMSGVSRNDY